jgi:hypothetical protein
LFRSSAPILPQHSDQHRPERPILLAVDQQLGEGAALRVAPELADPVGSLEVREHEDVEKLGAGEPDRARRDILGAGAPARRVSRVGRLTPFPTAVCPYGHDHQHHYLRDEAGHRDRVIEQVTCRRTNEHRTWMLERASNGRQASRGRSADGYRASSPQRIRERPRIRVMSRDVVTTQTTRSEAVFGHRRRSRRRRVADS